MYMVDPDYWQGKRVLILGASGFIGSALTKKLANLGTNVIATGRSLNRLQSRFADVDNTNITFAQVDICQPLQEQLRRYTNDLRFNVLIDAASPADPLSFSTNPVGVMRANIDGAFHALEFVRNHGGRLVYVSSGEIYGLMSYEHLVREDESGYIDTLNPRSCYPSAKRAAENLCASFTAQYGLDTLIARPAHIFGSGFTDTDSRASAQFFRDAMAGHDIVLHSSGTQHRTFTYISDCVSGLLTIAAQGQAGQAYNISNSDNNVTFREFAQTICDVYGVKLHFPNDTQSNNTGVQQLIRASSLDDSKLRGLGWEPKISLIKGVEEVKRIYGR